MKPTIRILARIEHPDDGRYAAEIFDAGNGPRVRYAKRRRKRPSVFEQPAREWRHLQSFTAREVVEILAPLAMLAVGHPAMQHGEEYQDDPDGFGFGNNEISDADVEASAMERAA